MNSTDSPLVHRLMQAGTIFLVFCLFAVLAVLLGGIVWSTARTGLSGLWDAFSMSWNPQKGQYGIVPILWGSFVLAISSTLLAIPMCLGLLAFVWGEELTLAKCAVRLLVRFMVSIPTVVYGFCAVILLVPLMREGFAGTGLHLLTSSLVLALLILPTMTLVFDTALQQLGSDKNLFLATAALGLNRRQYFWLVAMPAQKRWFMVAVLLAMGRALGDTMLPLMLSGNAPVWPEGPLSSFRTLATHIGLLTATEITPNIELTLYLAGTLLLLTSTGANICGRFLSGRSDRTRAA